MIDSREKGARGERELAKYLLAHGVDAQRGQQKSGGVDSPDVKHAIRGLHIECKRVERLNIWEAMAQAVRDAASKLIPSVWYRRNHGDWWVSMPAAEAIALLKKAGMV